MFGYDGSVRIKADLNHSDFDRGIAHMTKSVNNFGGTLKKVAGTLRLLSGTETIAEVELPPAGGGEGGTSDHRSLTGRDAGNQHPIAAITGLAEALETIPRPMTADELRKILLGGTKHAHK